MHPAFEMDIVEMDRFVELLRIVGSDDVPVSVEEVALAIAFVDLAKQPAVPVRVAKLCVLEQLIEISRPRVLQKLEVRPQPAQARTFRIAIQLLLFFVLTRIVLLFRIKLRGVALIVPPGEPHVTRDHIRAGVHVTDHALRTRNPARELMPDRMARLVLRNTRIGSLRPPEISSLLIDLRVRALAIVRI